MTNLRLHWQGRPHHTPRIRVASTGSSASRRSHSRIAAEQVARHPLSPTLARARRDQKVLARTLRTSSHSTTVSARRRALCRAKHRLQTFGWNSSTAEQAIFLPRPRHPSLIPLSLFRHAPLLHNHLAAQRIATIPSIDGAGQSTARKRQNTHSKDHRSKKRQEPIHFIGRPLFATTNRHRRIIRHSASVSPLSTARRHQVYHSSTFLGRGRSYDLRIAPLSIGREASSRASKRSRASSICHCTRPRELAGGKIDSHNSATKKPASSMDTRLDNQEPLAQIPVISKLSISVSRSPSERKALKKFTKELERYLRATRDLPQQPSSSSSLTTVSARTITELKPYRSQFKAAGLAVTSDEQRGMSFGKFGSIKNVKTPRANSKDRVQYVYENVEQKDKSIANTKWQPSYASGSSGSPVLSFTPLQEKTYGQSRTPIQRRHSSSGHTIVSFTPPHEMEVRVLSASPGQPTRKALPWLRKQDVSPTLDLDPWVFARPTTIPEDVMKDMKPNDQPSTKLQPTREARGGTATKETGTAGKPRSPEARSEIIELVNPHLVTERPFLRSNVPIRERSSSRGARKCLSRPSKSQPQSSALRTYSSGTPRPGEYSKFCTLNESACISEYQNNLNGVPCSNPDADFVCQDEEFVSEEKCDQLGSQQSSMRNLGIKNSTYPFEIGLEALHCPLDAVSNVRFVSNDDASSPNAFPNAPTRQAPLPAQQQDFSSPNFLNHKYLTRSSTICQQCFPSRQASCAISPLQTASPTTGGKRKTSTQNTSSLSQEPLLTDSIKKCLPRILSSQTLPMRHLKQRRVISSISRIKPLPRIPEPLNKLPLQSPSSTGSINTRLARRGKITDKLVFRGLHVATAAACDDDIDRWIEDITGFRVRRFLADLSKFDGLGVNALANVARRAAKQRREEVRAWEALRAEKLKERGENVELGDVRDDWL